MCDMCSFNEFFAQNRRCGANLGRKSAHICSRELLFKSGALPFAPGWQERHSIRGAGPPRSPATGAQGTATPNAPNSPLPP
eukprot:12895314-Prorocentrum_lima.AAC.1